MQKPALTPEALAYFAECGRRGGRSKSLHKLAVVEENLKRARAAKRLKHKAREAKKAARKARQKKVEESICKGA